MFQLLFLSCCLEVIELELHDGKINDWKVEMARINYLIVFYFDFVFHSSYHGYEYILNAQL